MWKGTYYPPQYSAEILNFGWRDDYVMWFNNPNEVGDDGTHFGKWRQCGNVGNVKANVKKSEIETQKGCGNSTLIAYDNGLILL